jgi:hypothetical protein
MKSVFRILVGKVEDVCDHVGDLGLEGRVVVLVKRVV